MAEVLRFAAILIGALCVNLVLVSAIRTVVLPRDDPVRLTSLVFRVVRRLFDIRLTGADTYEERDRRLALYAPLALISMPFVWVALVMASFTLIFWGLHVDPVVKAFELSGSSVLTLGFVGADDVPTYVATFLEAIIGLGVLALLISYLPVIYEAFQRRELLVARLATRAGDPPSPVEIILLHHRLARLAEIDEMWDKWETWFADIEETHTSQPALVYFRSISHERSWVTSAGVVLDAAALRASTLRLPRNARAELCIRAGYLSLRRIAAHNSIPFDANPQPDDPISITHDEFIAAYETLAAEGVPVQPDRERCWRNYAGWRVNYDDALLGLAALTVAPYAMWSSDRSALHRDRHRPFLYLRRSRSKEPSRAKRR